MCLRVGHKEIFIYKRITYRPSIRRATVTFICWSRAYFIMHFFIEFVTWFTDPRNEVCKVTQTTSYVLTTVTLVSQHWNRVCDVTGKLTLIVTTETLVWLNRKPKYTIRGLIRQKGFVHRVTYIFTLYLQKLLLSQNMPIFAHTCANLETFKCRNDLMVDNRSYVDTAFFPLQ